MCFACGTRVLPDAKTIPEFDPNAEPYSGNTRTTRTRLYPGFPSQKGTGKESVLPPMEILSDSERAGAGLAFVESPDPLTASLRNVFKNPRWEKHAKERGVHHVMYKGNPWTAFEYRDILGGPLAYKLIQYGKDGHRIGGKVLWTPPGKACYLFGTEILWDKFSEPVVLVESEKTAVIASYILPEFVWIATGGANRLTGNSPEAIRRATTLLHRKVLVFFDADQAGERCTTETIATLRRAGAKAASPEETKKARKSIFGDRSDGTDIADLLMDYARRVRV